ncbi:hypothetical protein Ddye_005228 [Dipteronia dyeriana]|uniref:Uncharacterized protein n=1 Tax=Dipteronia dyeriana TaxID=168575 RepID=A0AAD9XFR4_9ROSI|nr:hypothetical protein Ddye_005228 [Dipteronia dyeriana]
MSSLADDVEIYFLVVRIVDFKIRIVRIVTCVNVLQNGRQECLMRMPLHVLVLEDVSKYISYLSRRKEDARKAPRRLQSSNTIDQASPYQNGTPRYLAIVVGQTPPHQDGTSGCLTNRLALRGTLPHH